MTTGEKTEDSAAKGNKVVPGTEEWQAARRDALFNETFAEILRTGERRDGLRATGGLRAWEVATRERGGIVFVENPDPAQTLTGAVIPYLPEVTLKPGEVFPWVHDAPIGVAHKYLAAYAGLVKSDARVLTMGLRPDPYDGARVYVYGEPGEIREVVLFNTAGGEAVAVTFADAPQVYPVGPSQVVALSTELAGRTFFCGDDDNAPVVIGPNDVYEHDGLAATVGVPPGQSTCLWTLAPDGSLTETWVDPPARPEPDYAAPDYDDSGWAEIGLPTAGDRPETLPVWFRATVHMDPAADATLHFSDWPARLTLWVNGDRFGSAQNTPEVTEASFPLRLPAGQNVFCLLAEGHEGAGESGGYGSVILVPSGGCYLMDVARWRFLPDSGGGDARQNGGANGPPSDPRAAVTVRLAF